MLGRSVVPKRDIIDTPLPAHLDLRNGGSDEQLVEQLEGERFGGRGCAFGSVVLAIAALSLGVTLTAPQIGAQTTPPDTWTIGGVAGWSGSDWGSPRPTVSFFDAQNGKPLVRLTSNWSGAWFQAPRPVTATHIQSFLTGQLSSFIGVKLADGRFKWVPTDAFVGTSGAGFNGGSPALGLIPIAELFGLSPQPMSIQAVAYMRDGSAIAPSTFAFDAVTTTAPDALFVELARSTTNFSTSVHTTPWGCANVAGTTVATTCAWGGIGIERRSRDWSFQRLFPAVTFACTFNSNNTATTEVFNTGGALVTLDRSSVPLRIGQNLTFTPAFGEQFRFTVAVPVGTKQIGLLFAKPVNFRYDPDARCTLTSPTA